MPFDLTCSICQKRWRLQDSSLGKMMRCPECYETFIAAPDDDPRRMVDVWFSKGSKMAPHERVKWFIETSKKTLDIAMYSLTHDWLKLPLENAKRKGVEIRIMLDREMSNVAGSDYKHYVDTGFDIRLDDESGKMHHKFAIRDGATVLTGSYNWTKSGSDRNRESFLVIRMPHIVQAYQREFESTWKAEWKKRKAEPVDDK